MNRKQLRIFHNNGGNFVDEIREQSSNVKQSLEQHRECLGHWENWYIENGQLLGYPVFDLEDELAQKIANKVNGGHLKGCSMGIIFNPEDLIYVGGKFLLLKCELAEVSIVAVPSNKASVSLYKKENEAYTEEEIKSLCLSLKKKEFEINDNMKKITLSIATLTALGFDKTTPEVDVETIELAVQKLSSENTSIRAKLLALESEKEVAQEAEITKMVDLAIKEGRISATKKKLL
uniref:Prohead serine protease domain-containing protein n=1 Tax=Flavobacterium columnare TaxID=996 RepID=A0AA94F322_9FLAO